MPRHYLAALSFVKGSFIELTAPFEALQIGKLPLYKNKYLSYRTVSVFTCNAYDETAPHVTQFWRI